jgi:NADH dehydrogenase FAD-containing subunit
VSGPITLNTDKGTSIEADIVLRCTGFKVNADAYRSKLSDKMDHNTGTLKVNTFLQVEEMDDVFAVGDCNNTDELKLAYVAGAQAGTIFQ